jgi:hypothetical protein
MCLYEAHYAQTAIFPVSACLEAGENKYIQGIKD